MISRRDLIKSGGALVVSFGLRTRVLAQTTASVKPVDPKEVDSFLAFHADGSVTVYTGKVDLGTGLRVAIRQMAAEELGVPVDKVTLVEGDTGLTPDQGSTGGSTGLTRGGIEVRQAAATARQALSNVGQSKLAEGQRFFMKVDPKAPLKDPAQYTVVGQPIRRPDLPAKCTGKHTYVQDFVLTGMLYGRVIRPPAIGAKLMSVDETSIKGIPDVRVVRKENFLGVVAKDEWAAIRASRELKATWSDWEGLPGNAGLERFVRYGAIDRDDTLLNKGSTDAALASASQKFSAKYFWPNQSHGSIGPSCAVADVRDGGVTVWSASQGPHGLRQNLAKIFRMPEEKVRVVYLDGAGCYGGNGNEDVAVDAVLLSQAVGAPVRVQWMRHDEHGWDPKGPQQILELRAGLDTDGRIVAWENQMWVPTNKPGSRPLLAADLAGIPQDHGQGAGLLTQNGDAPYNVPNVRVVAHLVKETALRPSNLRAPGKIANVFAVESFTDELASAVKIDPVAYRLRGLSDPRGIAVLKRAAELFSWQERPSPNPNAGQGSVKTGRGIAYARYKQSENYVALAMEVGVDTATGKIDVRRIACAHDCGLVVNPDALKNQIEGCILQTLSRALHEEVRFDRSRVTSLDWASYPILTFPEVPPVEVGLINHPELPLLGAGEASCVTVAAALANAVFDATGAKLRVAPFIPERVKGALA
jgi:CO/xanthine dehydrogenase Mo-binding subunit